MATAQSGTAGTAPGPVVSARTTAAVEGFAGNRGISHRTLEQLRVGSATGVWFGSLKEKRDSIAFRYFEPNNPEPIYVKFRPDDGEKVFTSQKGGRTCFYNLDAVLAGSMETVFIVEGEFDAAALIEAGVPIDAVLSVPTGASERKGGDGEDDPIRGYRYVAEALAAGLSKAKRFVFCGDSDAVGRSLRQDLVNILGAARFWFVDWPQGIKDANEFLLAHGRAALKSYVTEKAKAWPVTGIYRMGDFPEPPPMVLWNPGFPEWESKVRLGCPALSVVTGQPGHGKTNLFAQIVFNIVRDYDVPAFITTFETRAKPHMRRILRSLHSGKLEKEMSEEEERRADRWIHDRYLWGQHEDDRPDLGWWLDRAEAAVIRGGAKLIQLDPWNRLETHRDGRKESETEFIGRCLTEIYKFAVTFNVHVQILAHPAKMDGKQRGRVPELEDISGSKNWDNRVDQGFVVHRKKMFEGSQRCTEAALFYRKSRFPELGHPCQLNLDYDLTKGCYRSTDYDVGGYGR